MHRNSLSESKLFINKLSCKFSQRKESEETPENSESSDDTEPHAYKEILIDR